jgi:hypothetical protein
VLVARCPSDDVVTRGEESRAQERERGAAHAVVLGPRSLAREHNAPEDDQHGADDKQRPERLAWQCQCDQDRHEWSRSHEDRSARRPGIAHGERQDDLRCAGGDQAGDDEGLALASVESSGRRRCRGGHRDDSTNSGCDECADLGIGTAAEAPPYGDC